MADYLERLRNRVLPLPTRLRAQRRQTVGKHTEKAFGHFLLPLVDLHRAHASPSGDRRIGSMPLRVSSSTWALNSALY